MKGLKGTLRLALLGIGGAIYLALGYLASSSTQPPLFAVLITAIPVVAAIVAAAWRSAWRWPVIALCCTALVAMWQHVDYLLSHAAWLYFIQHIGAMAALGAMFGSTLGSHQGALCSRIAAFAIAQPLDAAYCQYTWRVTLVWTLYFVVSAVISLALFCLASLEQWSLFAAVVTPVSVAVMFGAEYMIRLRALPNRPHFSIAQTIESYQKYVHSRS